MRKYLTISPLLGYWLRLKILINLFMERSPSIMPKKISLSLKVLKETVSICQESIFVLTFSPLINIYKD